MSSGASLIERRPSSHGLPPLIIPRPSVSLIPHRYNPTPQDVEEEGRELLQHFIFQNIHNERLSTPEDVGTVRDYQNPLWARTGRELRILADRFAATRERQHVKQRASTVALEALNWEEFRNLLSGVFEGGITKERIVVLFVFCSDLAIRCLQAASAKFRQLLSWSTLFLKERVCSWVQARGGWKNVIEDSTHVFSKAVLYIGAAIVITVVVKKLFS